MLKKRWLAVLAGTPVCICLGLFLLALVPPEPGVTRANFDRVSMRMTRAEVEILFGGPPNSDAAERPGKHWIFYVLCANPGHARELWLGDDGAAMIEFDEEERVTVKEWLSERDTLFQRFRDWLGGLIERD